MTAYQPNPVVEFDGGIFYADNTISSITINMGRPDVTDQPQPSYARVELWTDANTPLNVSLSQNVAISIDKGTSGTQQIFNGTISDIDIDMVYGQTNSIARYAITAVGPLALLNRHIVGGAGFPKQTDGERVLDVLTDAFLTSWDDVSPTLTWNDIPNDVTWDSYDATNIALVNGLVTNVDVGTYELEIYSDGEADALTLAQVAANSGRGVLWESADGALHYDDYASRASNPVITLTADDILAQGLRTAAQWGEIVNDVTVTYRVGSESARDEQSTIIYGQLSGTRETVLHNQTDAANQAADFVSQRAYPRMYPEQLTIPLHSPTVSDATRDTLTEIYNGARVQTSALPAVFGTNFDGFVEGWTWNLTRYTADLTLTCSAYSETYSSIIWLQLPPTMTWADYGAAYPTTRWSDL